MAKPQKVPAVGKHKHVLSQILSAVLYLQPFAPAVETVSLQGLQGEFIPSPRCQDAEAARARLASMLRCQAHLSFRPELACGLLNHIKCGAETLKAKS